MRVVGLHAENLMRLRVVDVTPGEGLVVVGGRNAQGKTSLLDSIAMAIGGMRLCPKVPIREGESEAHVEVDLGDLRVRRSFTWEGEGEGRRIKSRLAVLNASGEPIRQPQSRLNELVGTLSFDPLEFARMGPSDRARTLRELVGLDVEQLEEELQRTYDSRTIAGQEKRAAEAVVADMPVFSEVPAQPVSVAEVADRMAAAVQRASELEELRGISTRAQQRVVASVNNLRAREAELLEAQKRVEVAEREIRDAEAAETQASIALEAFEVPDVQAIRAELSGLEEINRKVRENQRRAEKIAEAEEKARRWKGLDQEHGRIAQEIKRRTEAVVYPVDGLELRRDGVYYRGVPFEQASRAERIRVSLSMGVSMNPRLKVLLIRDGSVLDEESLKVIAQVAEEYGYQFWVEMARGYGEGSILIEDGEVQG